MTFVLALLWGGNLVFEAYATDVRTELISRKTITDKICLISEQIRLLTRIRHVKTLQKKYLKNVQYLAGTGKFMSNITL